MRRRSDTPASGQTATCAVSACQYEPWTETSGASFYDAAEFSGMLRESVLGEDG